MRIPIYVHTEVLTEPSIYPYSGYFDILCVCKHASVRCSGQITPDLSFQESYFMARYVETRIRKIIKIALSYVEADDFFHHFWTGFINSNLTMDDESQKLDDDIVMLIAWQSIDDSDSENSPICISGIGISQIFASTRDEKIEWAPIVQRPHPFFRPLGKPDKTVGFLSIHTPLIALGYTSLYSVRVSYSKISKVLLEVGWVWDDQFELLEKRLDRIENIQNG
jgi:hypothetical protein